MKCFDFILLAASGLLCRSATAATLASGSATFDYDRATWDLLAANYGLPQPTLTLAAFFNQTQANTLTYAQTLSVTQTNPSPVYTNQVYAMNGATVTNLPNRTTQPTTFAFAPGNLTNHTGSIGLGGIARFKVTDPPGGGNSGNLLFGDFTLQFSTARSGAPRSGSGWYLKGNIPPIVPTFDLLNVNIIETPQSFTLTGDLCVTYEVANLLYSTPADALRDVGDFVFTATIASSVPAISVATVSGSNFIVQATNGIAGTSYAVLSSTNLTASAWVTNASGVFDSSGTASNAIPLNPGEPMRWYRLKQP